MGSLAPVHALTGLGGIKELCPMAGQTYLHILTEDHNIVMANGLAAESMLLTRYSADLARPEPGGIVAGPPDTGNSDMPPARPILHNGLARTIAQSISNEGAGDGTRQAQAARMAKATRASVRPPPPRGSEARGVQIIL